MINKVRVTNSYGESLEIELRNPEKSGYAITAIGGLGPVSVDLKQTQMVSGMRYRYNKGFFKYRTIQFQIVYYEYNNLGKDVVELRQELYRYFKNNDLITLTFYKDNNQVFTIQGYPDNHDPNIFASSTSVTISVTCPDPWFKLGETQSVQNWDSEVPGITIPIEYLGDTPSGFYIETDADILNFSNDEMVVTVKNKHAQSDVSWRYESKLNINVPDISDLDAPVLHIDLRGDQLKITMYSDETYNVVGWVDIADITKRGDLPKLLPGYNEITLSNSSGVTYIDYSVYYDNMCGGL